MKVGVEIDALFPTCRVCKSYAQPVSGEQLLVCAGYHSVHYCYKQHQVEDWKRHKAECAVFKAATKDDKSKKK